MNKLIKSTLVAALVAAGALASGSALAWHRGGAHVGVFIGGPAWYPYYPYPYYAYPPTVIVREAPPTQYIEQSAPEGAQQQQGYWYYCADSKTYYPYVKDCPAGWQKVVPQAQPAR
jgi:hypothetical protein